MKEGLIEDKDMHQETRWNPVVRRCLLAEDCKRNFSYLSGESKQYLINAGKA